MRFDKSATPGDAGKKNQGAKKIMQKEKSQDGDVFRRVFHDYHSHSPESIHNIELWERVKVEQVNKNYALFDCQ